MIIRNMELFYILLQLTSSFALGFSIGRGMIWVGHTKIGKIAIAVFLMPYIVWIFYKLAKSEFLAELQSKLEREKITYYFESSADKVEERN